MDHPKDIGDRTTLAVMWALREINVPFSIPFGENTRYDLVIEEPDGRLARVQCKTGRLRNGAVLFALCSAYGHHRNPKTHRRDYRGQVEYFAVYCAETTGIYLIPIQALRGRVSAALRVADPANSQRKFVRFARDFEIARVQVTPPERPRATRGLRGSAGA